jgi:regulator of replication initiation timing
MHLISASFFPFPRFLNLPIYIILNIQTNQSPMLAFEQTIPLNSSLLEQEPLFGFGFNPWSTPDSNDAGNDTTRQENILTPEEWKRQRRMKTNRESARRSRMRKRIHLEELMIQLDQLQAENHDLRTQLGSVVNQASLIRRENRRLQIEVAMFKRRLDETRSLLSVIRQLRRVNMLHNFHGFDQGQAGALASLIV